MTSARRRALAASLLLGACGTRFYEHEPPTEPLDWPNEPAGWTALSDHGFTTVEGSGWTNANPADLASGQVGVEEDASAPKSPRDVLQVWFPTGFTAGNSPALVYFAMPQSTSFYVGMWWKASAPMEGDSDLVHAFSADGRVILRVNTFGQTVRIDGHISTTLDDRSLPSTGDSLALGTWYLIEWHCDIGTPSTCRWWIDDARVGNYDDLQYSPGATFEQIDIVPLYAGPTKSVDSYFWYDHIRLSTP